MANLFDPRQLAFLPNRFDTVLPPQARPGMEPVDTERADETFVSLFGTPMYFPLRLKLTSSSDDFWLLPTEPLISVSGQNQIARSTIAKVSANGQQLTGTIKERWSADDYSISIEGLLTRKETLSYPKEDVARLRALMESRDTIDVICPLFESLGITRIVVENYEFPFTVGEENQRYTISAYSDSDWDLFIPLKK